MRHDLKDSEWKTVFVNDERKSIVVLPKNLELLVNNFKDHPEWKIGQLRKFLLNESNARYELLKEKNPGGYEVLKHLAFLNGSSIDKSLIEDLLKDQLGDEYFGTALNKLVKNTYLSKKTDVNSREIYYEIHESTQIEVKAILNEESNQIEKDRILNRIAEILDSLVKNFIDNKSNPEVKKLKSLSHHTLSIIGENCKTKTEKANFINLYKNMVNALDQNHLSFFL